MLDLFLEDGDLLEQIELNQFLQEANLFGVRINPAKLEDEEYIKSIIREIEDTDNETYSKRKRYEWYTLILGTVSLISIFGAPLFPLLVSLSDKLKYVCTKEGEYKYVIKKIDDLIISGKDSLKYLSGDNRAKAERSIAIMEKNKQILIKRQGSKPVDSNTRYGQINNKVYWWSLADDNVAYDDSSYEFTKKCINGWSKLKEIDPDSPIEIIAYLRYDANKMMTYLNKNKGDGDYVLDGIENKEILKVLSDKSLAVIFDENSNYIVYCFEDNCCYEFSAKYQNEGISKFTLSQLINASNKAYKALIAQMKEHDKK